MGQDSDDLKQATGRAIYANCRIGEIRCTKGKELIEVKVPGGEHWLQIGQAIGDVDSDAVKRQMIRRTIREHLDKELRLRPQEIKVLSLFFIDSVEHYRKYDLGGNPQKGKYALMFEEEYRHLAVHLEYQTLFKEVDLQSDATEVHNGYFSIDKKGTWTDINENNQSSRDNAECVYNLIMRDKEKLLSFEMKLKFIFSHSALREGWDSPNVFQICALRDMGTERERLYFRVETKSSLFTDDFREGKCGALRTVNIYTVGANRGGVETRRGALLGEGAVVRVYGRRARTGHDDAPRPRWR